MFRKINLIMTVSVALFFTSASYADSILVFESSNAKGVKVEHTISVSGRWIRLESQPKGKADYIVMDLGRMMMFEVSDKDKTFQLTRMGRLYWPQTALTSPRFKPVRGSRAVAGVRCQPVNEIGADNKATATHCMSTGGGALGLNAREMISLSRLFMSARRLGLDWSGVATPDERQISLLSENSAGTKQQFKSVVHKRIDDSQFKIPVNYKQLKPDFPVRK